MEILGFKKYMLIGLVSAGAILAGKQYFSSTSNTENISLEQRVEEPVPLSHVSESQFSGDITAHNYFNKLLLGVSGVVPEDTVIDGRLQLDKMYKDKIARIETWNKDNPDDQVAKRHLEVIDAMHDHALTYDIETAFKPTLENYVHSIDTVIHTTRKNLDFNIIKKFNTRRNTEGEIIGNLEANKQLYDRMVNTLSGADLVALSMTELLGDDNNGENRAQYEHILKTLGEEYLQRVPSQDKWPSADMYQNSHHAVLFTPEKFKGPVGAANFISQALPEEMQIPDSLHQLRGKDHHRVAALVAIRNITQLADRLSPQQAQKLYERLPDNHDEFLKIIGGMHNNPRATINGVKVALDDDYRATQEHYFQRFQPEHVGVAKYASRVLENFTSINSRQVWDHESPIREFTLLAEKNSEDKYVFKRPALQGDSKWSTKREFDTLYGSEYKPVSLEDIREVDGTQKERLLAGEDVYLVADKQ